MSREYPVRPIVGVGVVVWHGERVLLVQRGKPPRVGHWSLPGGAQQLGETVAQAARREVMEEVGLEVTLGDIVATVDLIERDRDDRIRYHYTLIDFVAEAPSAALRPGSDAAATRTRARRDDATGAGAVDARPRESLGSDTGRSACSPGPPVG